MKRPIPGQAEPVLVRSDRRIAVSVGGGARLLPRRGGHARPVRPRQRRHLPRLRDGAQAAGALPGLLNGQGGAERRKKCCKVE